MIKCLSSAINYVYERSCLVNWQRCRLAVPCIYGVCSACSQGLSRHLLACILMPVVWKCIAFCHTENVILLGWNRIPTGRFAAVCMAINTRCDAIHGLLAYERRPKALHFAVIFMRKCRCLDPKMRYLPLVNAVKNMLKRHSLLHTWPSLPYILLPVSILRVHTSPRIICGQTLGFYVQGHSQSSTFFNKKAYLWCKYAICHMWTACARVAGC